MKLPCVKGYNIHLMDLVALRPYGISLVPAGECNATLTAYMSYSDTILEVAELAKPGLGVTSLQVNIE